VNPVSLPTDPPAAFYVKRAEEEAINRQLELVRADQQSRVVILNGPGGVGKTSLVRQMRRDNLDAQTIWLEPIDVDDPDCWLLSNLEQRVADQTDPGNTYFADYRRRLSELPSSTHSDISHETIVSYLGRLQKLFAACYGTYVSTERKTVVIIFDTVETIRGTNLLLTLTQWMKTLPASTLFILSGRPPADDRGQPDQIVAELESPYQGMPCQRIDVDSFSHPAARDYIRYSGISNDLIDDEEESLVLLSRGHPLWLAFMIDYLRHEGMPPEATDNTLAYLQQHLPYDGLMSAEGERLHEAFLRRLVAPYREAGFWREAVKRLAVVRQPVARDVWQRLMSDCALPSDMASMGEAWEALLRLPWIRPRGNHQFVTLHDAVAEEFAKRLFPLHDQHGGWRHGIWRQALEIYGSLADEAAEKVQPALAALDAELRRFESGSDEGPAAASVERSLMDRSVQLDADTRKLDQLRAISLYYLFLTNYEDGCTRLLASFAEAERQHDSFFQDLLVLYLQRFLPGGTSSDAFNDVIKTKLDTFRDWLRNDRRDLYVALGIMVARYLVESSQSLEALKFLDEMPTEAASVRQLHDVHILRGNACLRLPGKVKDGLAYFEEAIRHAEELSTPDRHKLIAEAYKERGFYYRNTGQWKGADASYGHAWATIMNSLATDSPAPDRSELASIQTNWAYVKGLDGNHHDGLELVESAITIRHQIGRFADEGMSWSVCGEIYRYARRFEKAWAAYAQAEQLLQQRRYWARLGFIYQEQAICLYQAARDGINLLNDPMADARLRITRALDISVANSVRGYPSALNRAGRIFAATDPEAGLKYLYDGIAEAHRLSDGWFWFANLIEYVELSYRQWQQTGRPELRDNIVNSAEEIERVAEDFAFPDLAGRWSLLQGHLAVHAYEESGEEGHLDEALPYYERGFVNLAKRPVGSSGAGAVKSEFQTFRGIFSLLPPEVQMTWQDKLRSAWADAGEVSTVLLARLEEFNRPAG
jgi:tetratricopeptide (TPR) repeat protein